MHMYGSIMQCARERLRKGDVRGLLAVGIVQLVVQLGNYDRLISSF